jgi:ubiquitin-protein ligase E3 A
VSEGLSPPHPARAAAGHIRPILVRSVLILKFDILTTTPVSVGQVRLILAIKIIYLKFGIGTVAAGERRGGGSRLLFASRCHWEVQLQLLLMSNEELPYPSFSLSAVMSLGQMCAARDTWRPFVEYLSLIFSASDILKNSVIVDGEVDGEAEEIGIDLSEICEIYNFIYSRKQEVLSNCIRNSSSRLLDSESYLNFAPGDPPSSLRHFVILLQNPDLLEPESFGLLKTLCLRIGSLPSFCAEHLMKFYSLQPAGILLEIISTLQQFITLRLLGEEAKGSDNVVLCATRVLRIIYDASGLGGQREELGLECFKNDAVNEEIFRERNRQVLDEYIEWTKDRSRKLIPHEAGSLVSHPFLLDTAAKAYVLFIDSQVQMRSEMEHSINEAIMESDSGFAFIQPYVILGVRREHIVSDAILGLSAYRFSDDLKKPLKVVFQDEEAVDEGGVRREFYDILFQKLLSPQYAMFKENAESRSLWFNSDCLESTESFELVGIMLAMAVYNSVIVNTRFPLVIYRLLLGKKPSELSLNDLMEYDPDLARGLRQLLDFEDDVESTYGRMMEITWESSFGEMRTWDLVPGGSGIPLTNSNREQYVQQYLEFVLYFSVQTQYEAFERGFRRVCGEDGALELFSEAEELELLICGSKDLDFYALEKGAVYEDGYTASSQTIISFWLVAHSLSDEDKKRLLRFVTGSDRAPINGLESLRFVISKDGSDPDRLPSAHTCFGHLLLPSYETVERLENRLRVAIMHSEGFGLR